MDIGKKIATLRKKRGWTQLQLAGLTRISQQHLSLIERNRLDPGWKTLEKLFDALGYALSFQLPEHHSAQAIMARKRQWDILDQWETSFRAQPNPPSTLSLTAGLGELFLRLHADIHDPETIEVQARAIPTWRNLLSVIR